MDFKKHYEEHIKNMELEYLKENGSLEGFECDYVEECINTPELVVAYYVFHYGDSAKEAWKFNIQNMKLSEFHSKADMIFDSM